MRFKKTILLNPLYKGSHYSRGGALPAGLGYIAEMLEERGIDYDVLDMTLGYDFEDLVDMIVDLKPDVLCVGMMTYLHEQTYGFIRRIKRTFPSIKIVVGGQHASNFREIVMQDCDEIDYVIILDGEETMSELCEGKPLNQILGLMYREEGKIKYNGDRPFVNDLDKIPFPKYKKFEIERYAKYINVVSTRGCPDLCTFCPVKLTIGQAYRMRSAENVVEEIKYWYDNGVRSFGFVDDNFTLVKKRVFKICDLIEKNNLTDARYECPNGVRADRVSYELLKRMKDVNFTSLAFGVESADPQVLINIKKGETIETIDQAVKWSTELGFDVSLYFIIGNPGDTMKTIEKSFKFALKYPVQWVAFYSAMPFPRTELYDWVKKNSTMLMDYREYFNREQEHWSNMPVFETPEFTEKERKVAFRRSRDVMRIVQMRYSLRKLNEDGLKRIKTEILFSKPIYKIRNNYFLLDNAFKIYRNLPNPLKKNAKRLFQRVNSIY